VPPAGATTQPPATAAAPSPAALQTETLSAHPVETGAAAQPGYPVPEEPVNTLPPAPAATSEDGAPWLAYPPVPGDEVLERGNFFVDAITVLPDPAVPGQVDLYVEGSLPTPCNQPRFIVNPPDAENRINIELYSLVSTQMACVQVIQPFYEKIGTLTGLSSGAYTVMHEGQKIAEFSMP